MFIIYPPMKFSNLFVPALFWTLIWVMGMTGSSGTGTTPINQKFTTQKINHTDLLNNTDGWIWIMMGIMNHGFARFMRKRSRLSASRQDGGTMGFGSVIAERL